MWPTASRTASTAIVKQSPGELGGDDATGHSPLRPYIACKRSACSVLVGRPVLGPPRCTSITTNGNSVITAKPMPSDFETDAGAAGSRHAETAAERRADGHADGRDLVLGLDAARPDIASCRQVGAGCRRRA